MRLGLTRSRPCRRAMSLRCSINTLPSSTPHWSIRSVIADQRSCWAPCVPHVLRRIGRCSSLAPSISVAGPGWRPALLPPAPTRHHRHRPVAAHDRARSCHGLYAELEVAEIVEGLCRRSDSSVELVIAADVLIYLHDLAPVLREATRVLTPDGMLAFTAETHDGEGVALGAGLRYAQSEDHLRGLIAAAGLALIHLDHVSSRTERGDPHQDWCRRDQASFNAVGVS
jgi:SAM-dependent methyltransferase